MVRRDGGMMNSEVAVPINLPRPPPPLSHLYTKPEMIGIWSVGECSENIRGWPEMQRPWHQLEFSDWKSMDEFACREAEARLVTNIAWRMLSK